MQKYFYRQVFLSVLFLTNNDFLFEAKFKSIITFPLKNKMYIY